MSRKPREWYPGATYHITARGNRKAPIFLEPKDYRTYFKYLEETREKKPFILHSYCLMTNHLHLQIETQTTPIQEIMKDIQSRYAIYFNKKNDLVGHLYQGRYGAKIITTADYFLDVSRYIHLNPYEAKIVDKPEDYPWSSFRAYISGDENPHVDISKILAFFPPPSKRNYYQFVKSRIDVEDFFKEHFFQLNN